MDLGDVWLQVTVRDRRGLGCLA